MNDYRDDLLQILKELEEVIRDLYQTNGTELEDVFELIPTNEEV